MPPPELLTVPPAPTGHRLFLVAHLMQQTKLSPTTPSIPLTALAREFLLIGCVALGGSAPVYIHAALVRRLGWLSEADLLEGIAFAQLTPGPNFSNLVAFVGARLRGTPGAAVALLASILPGALFMLSLAHLYHRLDLTPDSVLRSALDGVASAAVGVLIVIILKTLPAALSSRGGGAIALLAFVAVGWLQINIAWVLVTLVPVAMWLNRPGRQAARG